MPGRLHEVVLRRPWVSPAVAIAVVAVAGQVGRWWLVAALAAVVLVGGWVLVGLVAAGRPSATRP